MKNLTIAQIESIQKKMISEILSTPKSEIYHVTRGAGVEPKYTHINFEENILDNICQDVAGCYFDELSADDKAEILKYQLVFEMMSELHFVKLDI